MGRNVLGYHRKREIERENEVILKRGKKKERKIRKFTNVGNGKLKKLRGTSERKMRE